MGIEYAISGGRLEIDKGIFIKEMLCKDSRLRKLIDTGDLSKKPLIKKNESTNTYTVDYNKSPDILLEESYQDIFRSLKADYQGRIRGKVTIRVTCYTTFFTEIDLNSADETS